MYTLEEYKVSLQEHRVLSIHFYQSIINQSRNDGVDVDWCVGVLVCVCVCVCVCMYVCALSACVCVSVTVPFL